MHTLAIAALVSVVPVWAQAGASKADLLEALGNAAATFARTAPGLSADELLEQRGRIASLQVLKGSARDIKKLDVQLPSEFVLHRVESSWTLGTASPLHEARTVRTIDSLPVDPSHEARHALTLGLQSPDDDSKKKTLEQLEGGRLQGAAADFAPMLLLFTAARQRDYAFSASCDTRLRYRQIAGDDAFTEFRDRSERSHPAEGEIWFRESDLLPVRVTLNAEEVLAVGYILRNEAEVNYTPTRFGLAPSTVIHRQFLNQDLLVENRFSYSGYTGREALP